MTSDPFFFSLAGTDGSGKTTTLNMLSSETDRTDEPVLYLDKGSIAEGDSYVSSHLAALRDLVWGHPKNAPVHLVGEMHWMHLQAAWFHSVSHSRVRPALAEGRSVFTDGWYFKFMARVSLAPTLDEDRIAGYFDDVAEPDFVILLDVDPELTARRKRTFTEIEGGNFTGDLKVSQQTFYRHQHALRDKLLEMAQVKGWHVLPITDQTKEDVRVQVLAAIAEWKQQRPAALAATV